MALRYFGKQSGRLIRGDSSLFLFGQPAKNKCHPPKSSTTRRCLSQPNNNNTTTKPVAASKTADVALPTGEQLRILAFRAGIPMIGFGFMDNLVMITAGEAIDSTLGVALGISTLTAAGFGQCCSDVAGITCGGAVDAGVSKLRLPRHNMSPDQLDLRISRIWRTIGGCIGVVTGCLLGMSVLLLMDTERAERAKKAKELQSIFETIMKEGADVFKAERATLFMLDEEKQELWSQVATGTKGIIKVPSDVGLVGACVKSGELLNVPDAYEDDRFNKQVDARTGFHTRSVLVIPVKDEEGKTIGAIQMCNKKDEDGNDSTFTDNDEKLLQMMASHVKSFIVIVNE